MRYIITLISLIISHSLFAASINIVAAENFYGQLAKEIGGKNVKITNIISNPNADPHLFATSSSISMAISQAQIVIYNGANYDPWMKQILKSQKNLTIVNVANLMLINGTNVNPHIWYKPETMPTLALHLTNLLIKIDNAHKAQYEHNLAKFLTDNDQVQNKISNLKVSSNNITVTATEPVFNYMATAIGLKMQGEDFQWKIMNNTEPSPKMLASFLDLLNNHKVRVLFYNNQVITSTTKNVLAIAKKNNVPVVGINETMPQNISVNNWLIDQLNQTEKALQSNSQAQMSDRKKY